jgi:hypothetical protein
MNQCEPPHHHHSPSSSTGYDDWHYYRCRVSDGSTWVWLVFVLLFFFLLLGAFIGHRRYYRRGSAGETFYHDDNDLLSRNAQSSSDSLGVNATLAKDARVKDGQSCKETEGNGAKRCAITSSCLKIENDDAICMPKNPKFTAMYDSGDGEGAKLRCTADFGCPTKSWCGENQACKPRKGSWESCTKKVDKCGKTSTCKDLKGKLGSRCLTAKESLLAPSVGKIVDQLDMCTV